MSSGADPVRYGATLKLRHQATGASLRSQPFVSGRLSASGQATVTCFDGPGENDLWRVKGPHGRPPDPSRQGVAHGEVVRFEHLGSGKNLHSHTEFLSPVTGQQEVTCFGEDGVGDPGDDWRIEVEGGGRWLAGTPVRLIHGSTGHALHSHQGFEHAQWTMGQQEVTCFAERDGNDFWLASDLLANDASFVAQTPPVAIEVGQSQTMRVTMRNVGTAVWSADTGHRLGSQPPEDDQKPIWGRSRVDVVGSVAPGQDAAFSFDLTAATTRGPAPVQWRMLQEAVGWFGDLTPMVAVNVVLPGGPATVPDVRGAHKGIAMSAIRAAGLEPRLTGAITPRSMVVSQAPPPHSVVDRGSTVLLHLDTG
jgi:MIR domain-containing protein/PASTA domain-containing protein